jgi:hypothetical protein
MRPEVHGYPMINDDRINREQLVYINCLAIQRSEEGEKYGKPNRPKLNSEHDNATTARDNHTSDTTSLHKTLHRAFQRVERLKKEKA